MLLYSSKQLLEHALWGVILNVIKNFSFSHYTLIGFQMRWSGPKPTRLVEV
jgi:hypothetical protein